MTTLARSITGGVDTHLDVHVAAALDERGALLGVESFATTESGYKKLLGWLAATSAPSSWSASKGRVPMEPGSPVISRPNEFASSKSIAPIASVAGARASPTPKTPSRPPVPHSRATPVARPRRGTETSNPCGFCGSRGSSARKGRTQALNQMRNLVSTAPEPIRAELRGLNVFHLLERASSYRPGTKRDIVSLTKFSLRMLARRAITLEEEIAEIDAILKPLVKETAPELVATLGVGTDAASALLVAAGDNPERLRNEAAFAHLCGTSPLDASSGKNERHRLNRSGDRQANSALWHVVITRMVYDPRTIEYIDRRRKEGKTKKEAMRCLKRYVAREVFSLLPHEKLGLDSP